MIRADKSDIENGQYEFNLSALLAGTDTLPSYSTFDMLRFFNDSLYINSSNVQDYFWHIDGLIMRKDTGL